MSTHEALRRQLADAKYEHGLLVAKWHELKRRPHLARDRVELLRKGCAVNKRIEELEQMLKQRELFE